MKKTNPIPNNLKPFRPGKSGNPKGRPVGILNSATVIRKWLEVKTKHTNPLNDKEVIISQYDAIVLAQIAKAIKSGDTQAFTALIDRLEGRPMQRIDAEIKNETVNVEVPAEQRDQIIKAFKDEFY